MKETPKNITYDPRVDRARNEKTGRFVSLKDIADKTKTDNPKTENIEDKKNDQLELKILQLSNLSKNVISAFVYLDKKTKLFEKRISELESKIKGQTKERKSEKQSTVLLKIKDDLVKINNSFGNIIQLLSEKPITVKQSSLYESENKPSAEKKSSEFGWLKLLGFGLFAAAPYLIGLLRNLDPNKIKQTLNNVYELLTKGVPKFFTEDLPALLNDGLFEKIKNKLSNISLLDAAALALLLATFKGTIFSLLWKGLKAALSLPFKAAQLLTKIGKGCGSVLKCIPNLFGKIRIFVMALAAAYIGYKLGEAIANAFNRIIKRSEKNTDEYQNKREKDFKDRTTAITSSLEKKGSLSKYGIKTEDFSNYISQLPPGELEKIEKRVKAINESTDENIAVGHEQQIFENTDTTDSVGGALNLAGRITGVMDPKPIKTTPRRIETSKTTDSYQTIAGERVVPGQPLSEKQQVVLQIKNEMKKPANLLKSSAEEMPNVPSPIKDATREQTEEKSSKTTDSYQTIAGERVVPGQPLSEKQQAVMQIKKEMSGSSEILGSIQPSNKIDGKQLTQMSQEANRSKTKNVVVKSQQPSKRPSKSIRKNTSPDKEFLSIDEVPDPTVVFNNLEDQLFFSAA